MKSALIKAAIFGMLAACGPSGEAHSAASESGSAAQEFAVVSSESSAQETYAVGDTVDVSWAGGWYASVILAVRAGEYHIHYIGWESSWDEWVNPSRIRSTKKTAPSSGTAAAPGKSSLPAPDKVWSERPEGRYSCATFDAGQLNRIAEITLESGGRYRESVRGGSGRFDYNTSTRRVRFLTGPQKTDAPVTFDPTARAGKGWLMFDYGDGAKLHCYREALK